MAKTLGAQQAPNVDSIGGRVQLIRETAQLDQGQFAQPLRVSRSHISAIEHGHDKPSASLIRLMAIVYNVDEDWINTGAHATMRGSDDLQGDIPDAIATAKTLMARLSSWGDNIAFPYHAHRYVMLRLFHRLGDLLGDTHVANVEAANADECEPD